MQVRPVNSRLRRHQPHAARPPPLPQVWADRTQSRPHTGSLVFFTCAHLPCWAPRPHRARRTLHPPPTASGEPGGHLLCPGFGIPQCQETWAGIPLLPPSAFYCCHDACRQRIILRCWRSEARHRSPRAALLSGGSRGKSTFLPFPASQGHPSTRLTAPSSIFKADSAVLHPSDHSSKAGSPSEHSWESSPI